MLKSVFKCDKCESLNYIGDNVCRTCHQRFQYYCPYCGANIQGGVANCNSCSNPLSWPSNAGQGNGKKPIIEADTTEKSKGSWLWPLLGLILVIAVAAIGIYWFIRVTEVSTLPRVTANLTFDKPATYVTADTIPPVISNIEVKHLSYNAVEITWNTDEPSTSQVMWKAMGGSYKSTERKDAPLQNHSVELSNLTPKTTYYYKVISQDQFTNAAESNEGKFDIDKQPGVARVEVLWHSMSEQSPPPMTFIKGIIRNTGDISLRPQDIELVITIEVMGRQGTSEVIASIDEVNKEIKPEETRGFSTTVPNNTKPNYIISPRIIY